MDEATRSLLGRALRQLRTEANLSQRELACQVPVSQATLSRYESGHQSADKAMAARLDELLDTGGALSKLLAKATTRTSDVLDERRNADALEVEDMRRRTLLGLMGGMASGSIADVLEPVRRQLDSALTGPVTIDDAVEWEHAADQYSRQTGRLSVEQVLPDLLIDLVDVHRHLDRVSDEVGPRLLRVCALLSGLAATSLVGAGHWTDAERYWRTAQRASRFSGDREVRCLVASKRALLSLYRPAGNLATALGVADTAIALSEGRITAGSVNALAVRAQGLSLLGDHTAARATLAELETAFEQLDERYTERWTCWSWPETRLHHVRSFVHSHGGNIRDAVAAQDVALKSYERPLSTGAVQVQMHRARSIIASGDPSQGVRHIVSILEKIEPSFRRGYIGTSAKLALQVLPDKAKGLPEVSEIRDLISAGVSS